MNSLNIDEPYINVSKYSETELGRALAPGFPISLQTLFGKIGTLRTGMEYIVTPNYPERLLSKRKLKCIDLDKIPKHKIDVPNYWSVVTYLLCLRIKSDEKLIELLRETDDDTKFVSYNKVNNKSLGINSIVYKENLRLNIYTNIINDITRLIKSNVFHDLRIRELIVSYKDDDSKSVFEGLAIAIESDL